MIDQEYCGFEDDGPPVLSIMEGALVYAALGLRVLPLKPESKIPQIKNWCVLATTDPDCIRKWFSHFHAANLGLATGNGLIALDVDPRNGGEKSFQELINGRDFPLTAHAITGSGGFHYLFCVDPMVFLSNLIEFRPGLDLKGDGGMIVVEPSLHPETKEMYRWIRHPDQGIATAPDWLLEVLTRESSEPKSEARRPTRKPSQTVGSQIKTTLLERSGKVDALVNKVVEKFPIAGKGQRNAQMGCVIGSLLGRGYSKELTLTVTTYWWQTYYDMGVIGTSLDEAFREITACIESTLSNPNFTIVDGKAHRELCQVIKLDNWQWDIIDNSYILPVLNNNKSKTHKKNTSKSVTVNEREFCKKKFLCQTDNDRLFIEALIVHFTHKLRNCNELTLKATNAQFVEIMKDRSSKRFQNNQVERLKRRFISRTDQVAKRFELLVQTKTGMPGLPSEYKITGLAKFLRAGLLEEFGMKSAKSS